jgi:DNA replication protein DnaC
MSTQPSTRESLSLLLQELKLPTFVERFAELADQAAKEGWSFEHYLNELCSAEIRERRQRRIGKHLKQSGLPKDKTLTTLKQERLPAPIRRQLPSLCEGHFADRAENVLAFGLPGRGKTHLLCAVGHELIHRGYRVLFTPTYQLVQRLLTAKRDLALEHELRRLDGYQVVLIDDIGYVQQSREEMEVLFTFLAERYERRSVMITSNLVFSEWGRIFKDPMTTAAAIDRIVHHSVILELPGPTWRGDEAMQRAEEAARSAEAQQIGSAEEDARSAAEPTRSADSLAEEKPGRRLPASPQPRAKTTVQGRAPRSTEARTNSRGQSRRRRPPKATARAGR